MPNTAVLYEHKTRLNNIIDYSSMRTCFTIPTYVFAIRLFEFTTFTKTNTSNSHIHHFVQWGTKHIGAMRMRCSVVWQRYIIVKPSRPDPYFWQTPAGSPTQSITTYYRDIYTYIGFFVKGWHEIEKGFRDGFKYWKTLDLTHGSSCFLMVLLKGRK